MCPLSLKTSNSTQILASGKAKMWILLVGINHYQDEQFPDLDYSAMDCQELGDALTIATQEFPRRQVIVHHDFASQLPTLEAVSTSLNQLTAAARSHDTILFYFSGHGVIEQTTQQAVLCLSDTQNDALLDTGLRMQTLLQQLEACAARYQLLWLDACHSGSLILRGAKGVDEPTAIGSFEPTAQLVKVLRSRAAQSRGFYALLSCDERQRSWEFPELAHGVFTYYLIQGLRGEAADHEGVIEADALYRYVYQQTVQYIEQKNNQLRLLNDEMKLRQENLLYPEYPLQTPKRIIEGVGEVILGLIPETATQSVPSSTLVVSRHVSDRPVEHWENIPNFVSSEVSAPVIEPNYTLMTQRGIEMNHQNYPPTSYSPRNTHDSQDATKVVTMRHLAMFGYTAISLALLATGFVLGSVFGASNSQLLGGSNANADNAIKAGSQACELNVETPSSSPQPIEAKVLLPDCAAKGGWQQVKAQAFTGRFGAAWWVALTPDGNTLASVSGSNVEIRDLRTKETVHVLRGHTDVVHAIALSPDGTTLATGAADKVINIWDIQTGQLLQTLEGHAGVIWSLAFTPDGQTLASGGGDSTLRLWDLKTGTLARTLSGHQDRLFPVAFSPDSRLLVSGSKDTTIKLWEWQTGKELQTLTGHTDTVRALVFDPTGQRIATGSWDGTVRLWDLQTGKELHSFTGHVGHVVSVAFSPDGKTLASGGIDNTIKVWDVENRTLLATLQGHIDWILSVVFSADGSTLVSGGRDGTVAIWKR
jgi:uncharacterized caspase-like protein